MKIQYLIIPLLAVLFASCDKTGEAIVNENESLSFYYHRYGSFSGLNEKFKITADSIYYSISYHNLHPLELISYETQIQTPNELWNSLTQSFNWETFTKIQTGPCRACLDGLNEEFSVTKSDMIYTFTNGNDDKHYKQMQDFFDAMLIQASVFRMDLSDLLGLPSSFGCSSFRVYKINYTGYNDIGIAVTGNREKLNLSETEQTFDLSKIDAQDLNVEIKKFASGSQGYYCDCVFEGELSDTWTSVSGTVKIKIVQDYEGNPETFEKIYIINVILENIILKNDKENIIIVNQLEFKNVSVGWLPG